MKRFLAAALALTVTFSSAVSILESTAFAGFTIVNNAQTAVEKNKELFLKAFNDAEITADFTKSDLEDMLFDACKYSSSDDIGAGIEVVSFKITSPGDSKPGSVSAGIVIYLDDAEEAFEVKKEIPALSGNGSSSGKVTVGTGNETDSLEDKYTDAEISAMKKELAAAKKAISDAIWEFDVSNSTKLNDILEMAKSALTDGSRVTVTLDKSGFKLTKSTTTVEGSVSASLTLTCEGIEEPASIGKTIPKIVTEASVKIEEDRAAMSAALENIRYSNKTTKEEMLEAVLAAVKNGSTVYWKDNFVKKEANFKENGELIGYLEISLDGETREMRIAKTIPKIVPKLPSNNLSVKADEWEVLRLTNAERAKVGSKLLTMVAPLQDACNIREIEAIDTFSHTRPDGTQFRTAISAEFKPTGAGENLHKCSSGHSTADDAMNGWMNSTAHRENILRESYDYIGVGMNDYIAVQIFACWAKPIVSVTTSANTMQFEDENTMMREYLICKSSDGIESYMPLDTASMTKIDGGYKININCQSPVIITIGKGGKDTAAAVNNKTETADNNQAASAFTDVKPDAYYANAVKWAVDKKITTGTAATAFSPDETCTRAQILTFLWRAVGSPKSDAENPFTDVAKTDYFYDAAIWASEKGMIDGSIFSGDTPCTRSSTVTYMWKNAGAPGTSASAAFTDVAGNAGYAQAVAWAVENGVTSGTSKTTFSPDEICSRGQIVTFLHRALQ